MLLGVKQSKMLKYGFLVILNLSHKLNVTRFWTVSLEAVLCRSFFFCGTMDQELTKYTSALMPKPYLLSKISIHTPKSSSIYSVNQIKTSTFTEIECTFSVIIQSQSVRQYLQSFDFIQLFIQSFLMNVVIS